MEGVDSLPNLRHQGFTLKFGPPISDKVALIELLMLTFLLVGTTFWTPLISQEGLEDPELIFRTQDRT